MISTFAQTINPGASNAADFQPPTGNPQNIGGQGLQQQEQPNVVNPQEALSNQQTADLNVSSTGQPLPAQPEVTSVQPDYLGLAISIFLLLLVLGFAIWLRKRSSSGTVSEQAATTEKPAIKSSQRSIKNSKAITAEKPKKPATKKAARRKKQAKRKK